MHAPNVPIKIVETMILVLSLFPRPISSVTDFSIQPITIEVPANGGGLFTLSEFFTIVDDDIDEDEQGFAIVAEIGPDVPENISCFQLYLEGTGCHGRRGATQIRITDNDRELFRFFIPRLGERRETGAS